MSKAVLVTDGDCGFCQSSAAWLERHFPGEWMNAPSESVHLPDLDLTHSDAKKQVWLLVPDENGFQKFGGAMAVAKLLLIQPKKYIKPIAKLAFAPFTRTIAQSIYVLIARNRHRFHIGEAQCEMPANHL